MTTTKSLKALKTKVEHILKEYPDSRNDDILLAQLLWVQYYQHLLFKNDSGKWSIRLATLHELPKNSAIERIRRQLTEPDNSPYRPTIKEVYIKRGYEEVTWRNFVFNQ